MHWYTHLGSENNIYVYFFKKIFLPWEVSSSSRELVPHKRDINLLVSNIMQEQ